MWEINNKFEEVQEITNVGKESNKEFGCCEKWICVAILLYVVKLYKKQIVGIVNRKEFSNKELRVNLVTRKLLVRVIERISCFLWKSERDGKVVVDTNRIFTLKQVNRETNLWKVSSKEMCVGTRWMNIFHKKHL